MAIVQEKRFEYKGFPCVVLFMSHGYRCGYVGVQKNNKYFGKNYEEIPVDCHCGLTYSENQLFGQDDADTWWIGFDCGHACDGYDVDAIEKYFEKDKEVMKLLAITKRHYEQMNAYSDIRTLEYCINQCKHIVEQLEE